MTAIHFDRVSKHYPRYGHLLTGLKSSLLHFADTVRSFQTQTGPALDDVSFHVETGETVGVVGANGSGKSTALALMAGVLIPERGTVEVKGRVCPLLELGAGFHYDLTGRENIVLNGILLGLTHREVMRQAPAIVNFSELAGHLDQPLRTYSSGMVARLGFSIAVHLDPDILLIDEILSVGDLHFQMKCREKMSAFKREQRTIVFVSHSTEEIRRLCDRVVWLDRGRLVAQGAPDVVLPQYEASALGRQPVSG